MTSRLRLLAVPCIGLICAAPATLPAQTGDYPALYRSLGLPELPGATIVSTGRQTTSLRDGLAILLRTSSPPHMFRTFFVEHLEQAGWAIAPSRAPAATMNMMAGLEARKGAITFSMTALASSGTTDVRLNIVEP
jgi:hypothetical protein